MLAVAVPETRYAETQDGVYIAYQVIGDGPVDVASQFDWLGNVDMIGKPPCTPGSSGTSRPSHG